MATTRWYLTNGVDANGWQALSTTAQTPADTAAGWVVGTGATNNAELAANSERASTTFTGTTVPDGTLDTSLKDAFRIPVAVNGAFASANWTFQFTVVSPTQSGAADGQIVFRLIKANADGSSATEITSAQQSASVCTNVGSTDLGTAANVGTLTFNPGAITLAAGQFLFIQIAWKRTGAGGMTTTNIRFRTGSSTTAGTSILSADFTPATQAVTGVTLAATSVVTVPTVALTVLLATLGTTAVANAPPTLTQTSPAQAVTAAFIGGGGASDFLNQLVSYWSLGESNNLADAVDAHGSNTLTNRSFVGIATGKVGGARSFDNAAGHSFDVADNPSLSVGDLDFTFSCWVKFAAAPTGGASYCVFSKYDLSLNQRAHTLIWQAANNLLSFYVSPDGGTGITGVDWGTTPTAGVWYHVVCRHDAGGNVISIAVNNGTPVTAAYATGVFNDTAPFALGVLYSAGSPLPSTYMNGLIDEVGFWKRLLTTDEHTALYNDGAGLSYADLSSAGGGGGTTLFAPTVTPAVTGDQAVTGVFLSGGSSLSAPTVAGVSAQAITGGFIGIAPGALQTSLVSYWKLDEASGTALDAHDGTHPLTDHNSVGTGAGKINSARQFAAASGRYLSIADTALLSGGHVDFTISAWLNFDSVTGVQVAVAKWDPTAANLEYAIVYVAADAHLEVWLRNGAPSIPNTYVLFGYGVPTIGAWLHVVLSYDAAIDRFAVSVNGAAPSDSGIPSNGVMDTTAPFTIGAYGDGTAPFDGRIDEVGFWRRVLTAAERAALYGNGAGLSYDAFAGGGLTNTLYAPTVAPSGPGDQTITTAFLGATSQPFSPTVTTGAVTVVGGTVASTAQLFAPTVTPGAVTVTTPGRATTIQVFAPVLTAMTLGATIPSGSGVFAPSVALTITTATRASTVQLFAPTVTVGPATVLGATTASTAQLFLPIVSMAGVVNIGAATVTSTAQLFAPTVAPQAVGITTATRPTTAVLFAPSITAQLLGATIVSGSGVFPPTILPTQLVSLAAIAASSVPHAPQVGSQPIVPGVASADIFMWLT